MRKINVVEMAKKQRQIAILKKLQSGRINKSEVKELEQYEKGPLPDDVVDSMEAVAEAFGYNVRTVQRWKKEKMPVEIDGTYSLKKIQAWKAQRPGNKNEEGGSLFSKKTRWEIKRLEQDVRKRKIENDVRAGKLIPRRDVEKDLITVSLSLKRAFLLLPAKAAIKCDGQPARMVKNVLEEEVKNIIQVISESKIFDWMVNAEEIKKFAKFVEESKAGQWLLEIIKNRKAKVDQEKDNDEEREK